MESQSKFCPRCLNVGTVEIRPDQKGYLRRKEYETEQMKWVNARMYEAPNGNMVPIRPPYTMRVPCPECQKQKRKGLRMFPTSLC